MSQKNNYKKGEKRTDFQVKCPYNPSHQMPKSRLMWHILFKCKDKKTMEKDFKTCPYNLTHIIHEN